MSDLGPAEEASQIAAVFKTKLAAGEVWAFLDSKWWTQWTGYSGFQADKKEPNESNGVKPGTIDNSRLQSPRNPLALRSGLVEKRDYVVVHKDVWDLLHRWYHGGPELSRNVIEVGTMRETRIEMYPIFLRVLLADEKGVADEKTAKTLSFSPRDTLETVRTAFLKPAEAVQDDKGGEEDDNQLKPRVWITKEKAGSGQAAGGGGGGGGGGEGAAPGAAPGAGGEAAPAAGEAAPGAAPEDEKAKEPQDGYRAADKQELKLPLEEVYPRVEDSEGDDQPGGAAAEQKQAIVPNVMIEKPLADGKFARYVYERPWDDFRVGDEVDVLDTVGTWYGSTIKDVKPGKIFIHYQEWPSEWDEWITLATDKEKRLSPFRKHSKPRVQRTGYSSGYYSSSYYADEEGAPVCNGQVGLRNLGNTCFMNSTIQCLAQTPRLTDFFVTGEFTKKVNTSNPLGWQGKVAQEWGGLVQKLWANKYTVVAPRTFKDTIGEFQPRFSGYQQQDSQELLSFLLDGLHEDLNEVLKKPVTSAVESKGRPDQEVADESWRVYQMRNKSYIVDTVMGQLKSRLICPDCKGVSITFDPFMFLSVPLPAIEEKQQKVHVVPADPSKPIIAYGAVVSKMGVITDLKKAVSALCGIPPRRLVFCEVWNHRVERIVADDASVNEFREHDEVFAFEVPELEDLKEGEYVIVPVLNQFLERNQYYDPQYPYMKPYYLTAAALPTLIVLPLKEPGVSNIQLYQRLAGIARQWLKPEFRVREHKEDGKSGPGGEEPEVPPPSSAAPSAAGAPEAGAPGAPGGPPAGEPPAAAPPAAGSGDNDNNGQQGEPGAPGETQKPPPPPFLFRIVQLTAEGRDCRYHGYTSNCIGCPVEQDEKQFPITIQKNKQPHFSFGIQWAQNGMACDITRIRHERHDSAGRVLSSKAESVSLAQCLSAFSKPETLAEADAWYCPQCKKHVCAEKKMDIYRLPDIFICHLKRFSYTREWREKLSSFVDFPILELKMGDYCVNPEFKDVVYDLYGISNHMGGMGGGHYTAYVKNLNTGRWFEMDDSRAREVDPATIKSTAAYVLFYHKRGLAKHPVPEAGTPEPKRAAGDGEF